MNSSFRSRLASSVVVGGQHVAGTAVRDAIFLATFEAASLPALALKTRAAPARGNLG
jgi:hypothetical protein